MVKYHIDYNFNKKYNLTYGELTSDGLKTMLSGIDTENKVFYDLGSGKGSVVINAINNFKNLKKAVGIEIVKDRHNDAIKRREKEDLKDKIEFIEEDIFSDKVSLKDADIIYISNLCFNEEMNNNIAKKIDNEVKSGTIVFTSRKIPLENVSETSNTSVKQTWMNGSNIYINKIK